MINRDYILRMIEQLSRALSRVLLLRDAKEYHEAVSEIKRVGKLFLGLSPEAMEALSDRDLISLWSVGKDLDAEKCALATQIFRTEGDVYEHEGNLEEASASYEKSLSLLTETINFLKEKIPGELIATVDFLCGRLETEVLPLDQQQKLFKTYWTIGRFAKAEDLLFDIIREDPSFIQEGKRFYEHLLKLPDEDLVKGNLPRGEILHGLEELTRKAS
jgi:tetratricopeptide (TPR) repeat protein